MRTIQIGVLLGLLALLIVGLIWWRRDTKPHSVTLTWQAVSSGPDFTVVGYNVYRTTVSGAQYARSATRVPAPQYEDRLVNGGRTYFYVVTAVDQVGRESPFSSEVKVKVP
jgi:fibronectin type 3 domain-containing protein